MVNLNSAFVNKYSKYDVDWEIAMLTKKLQ
jgi:hypothetical protein